MRLVKNMFGHEFVLRYPIVEEAIKTFGLRTCQIRSYDFVHNGGWYNRAGERLGWGDLDPNDFTKIQEALDSDDVFIVLNEHDSYWQCPTGVDIQAPGVDYVSSHARFVISKTEIFMCSMFYKDWGIKHKLGYSNLTVSVLACSKEQLIKLIKKE